MQRFEGKTIVVTGGGPAQQPAPPMGSAPYYVPSQATQGAPQWQGGHSERRFKVVGEREEWIE